MTSTNSTAATDQSSTEVDTTIATRMRRVTMSSSDLDEQIFAAFERCRQQGVLRTDPLAPNVQRRIIPGDLCMVAAHEPDLFLKKRPAAFSLQVTMDTPFHHGNFHFNKVFDNQDNKETMMHVEYQGEWHAILVNVSPLMFGHGLLIPFRKQCLPQRLTPEAIGLALHVLKRSERLRIGFNSLGAFSSVNHLHLHLLYPDELDRSTNRCKHGTLFENTKTSGKRGFPVEHAPIRETVLVHETRTAAEREREQVKITTLDWKAPCFSLISSCAISLQHAVATLVAELYNRRIPHNVLLINGGSGRNHNKTSQDQNQNGIVEEDSHSQENEQSSFFFRAIVIPRRPQHCFDAKAAGFNAALGEISGYLIARTRQDFDKFEERTIVDFYQQQVAIAPEVLRELSTWIQQTL